MFKFTIPRCGVNFLRHFRVRSSATQKYAALSCSIAQKSHVQQRCFQRNNSSGSRIRNFYEYPDANDEDDEDETFYTNWEGVENRYAHSVMEKNKFYNPTIVQIPADKHIQIPEKALNNMLQKNWGLETPSALLRCFRRISYHAKNSHENIYSNKYENIIESLTNNVAFLDDNQLCHVLQSLMLWFIEANESDSVFSRLFKALDKECERRADIWSTKTLLYVSDHWYRLRLIQKSRFMLRTIRRLIIDARTLSARNLVQLMFYAGVYRTYVMKFQNVEQELESVVKNLNINELAILALGFFKSQSQIKDRNILTIMVHRTIAEIESINEFSLAAILKVVRYSIQINDLDLLSKLLESAIPQIPRLPVSCLAHVILAAAIKKLFHPELLNGVSERYYREISKLRLKDIRCLVFALASFDYLPEKQPNIFERIIEELNESSRQEELKKYPMCFAACLYDFTVLNIYPKNLIAQALNPENIEKAYGPGANTICRELFVLDLNIEAECPDYRGPRLDAEIRESIAMKFRDQTQRLRNSRLPATDYLTLDVVRACKEYFGSNEIVHVDHVLPHYHRPNVIICFDKTNSPIPLSSTLSKLPFGSIKHPPQISLDNIRWHALLIGSSNSYAKNANRLLGHICANYRQLEYIGYTPSVICWRDWMELRNDREKFDYLQCKVFHSPQPLSLSDCRQRDCT